MPLVYCTQRPCALSAASRSCRTSHAGHTTARPRPTAGAPPAAAAASAAAAAGRDGVARPHERCSSAYCCSMTRYVASILASRDENWSGVPSTRCSKSRLTVPAVATCPAATEPAAAPGGGGGGIGGPCSGAAGFA